MNANKKALVITYHVKNSIRLGGIHFFIRYLTQAGYDVDWVTSPVSLTWLLKNDDKYNARNFIDLVRGISWEEDGTLVRHFAAPIWIPAKIARTLGMKLGQYYYPKWQKLRRKLRDSYDVILTEGVACQYGEDLRRDYPSARIIYRTSDLLKSFSPVPNPEELELMMIKAADVVCCAYENQVRYYTELEAAYPEEQRKIRLLRNPLASEADIQTVKNFKPRSESQLSVVYVGVSFADFELIDYTASRNPDAVFYIIGPSGKSHDNIIYTGMLPEEEYTRYIKDASVGISPLNVKFPVEFTRKIIKYMKFLLPVVATCSSNCLNVPGFFCVQSREEFSQKVTETLRYSSEDREKLRDGYLRCMNVFSEEEAHRKFLECLR